MGVMVDRLLCIDKSIGGETVSTVDVEVVEASRGSRNRVIKTGHTYRCRRKLRPSCLTKRSSSDRGVPASPDPGVITQDAAAGGRDRWRKTIPNSASGSSSMESGVAKSSIDCARRCHDGRSSGPGFDSPHLHTGVFVEIPRFVGRIDGSSGPPGPGPSVPSVSES